ncbi:DUF6545 domain-containing protein [Streptomyces sp. NPDC054855]
MADPQRRRPSITLTNPGFTLREGLTGDELRAAILAAQIATALHTRRPLPEQPAQGARSVSEPDQMNALQEAAWLTQVSAALDHSPVAHSVLHAHRHGANSAPAQA